MTAHKELAPDVGRPLPVAHDIATRWFTALASPVRLRVHAIPIRVIDILRYHRVELEKKNSHELDRTIILLQISIEQILPNVCDEIEIIKHRCTRTGISQWKSRSIASGLDLGRRRRQKLSCRSR